MSKAYKCDICGELYEKRISLDIRKKLISITDAPHNIEKDICPECIDAIQSAINERGGIDE